MCDTRLLETNIPGNPQLNSCPEKTEKAVPVKQARSIFFNKNMMQVQPHLRKPIRKVFQSGVDGKFENTIVLKAIYLTRKIFVSVIEVVSNTTFTIFVSNTRFSLVSVNT